MATANNAQLLVGKGWFQGAIFVLLLGFAGLGWLAVRAYQASPPIPREVVGPDGAVVFTGRRPARRPGAVPPEGADGVRLGARARRLSRAGLHGRLPATRGGLREGEARGGSAPNRRADGRPGDVPREPVRRRRPADSSSRRSRSTLSGGRPRTTASSSGRRSTEFGLLPDAIRDPAEDVRRLTAFFAWTAWAGGEAPGRGLLLHQQLAAGASASATARRRRWCCGACCRWSALLGGIGLLFAAYGRFGSSSAGTGVRGAHRVSTAGGGRCHPAQRACAWFFLVMAVLFVVQTLAGGASQHYRADLSSFFGIDLAKLMPFNLARTWHVQLAICGWRRRFSRPGSSSCR